MWIQSLVEGRCLFFQSVYRKCHLSKKVFLHAPNSIIITSRYLLFVFPFPDGQSLCNTFTSKNVHKHLQVIISGRTTLNVLAVLWQKTIHPWVGQLSLNSLFTQHQKLYQWINLWLDYDVVRQNHFANLTLARLTGLFVPLAHCYSMLDKAILNVAAMHLAQPCSVQSLFASLGVDVI